MLRNGCGSFVMSLYECAFADFCSPLLTLDHICPTAAGWLGGNTLVGMWWCAQCSSKGAPWRTVWSTVTVLSILWVCNMNNKKTADKTEQNNELLIKVFILFGQFLVRAQVLPLRVESTLFINHYDPDKKMHYSAGWLIRCLMSESPCASTGWSPWPLFIRLCGRAPGNTFALLPARLNAAGSVQLLATVVHEGLVHLPEW